MRAGTKPKLHPCLDSHALPRLSAVTRPPKMTATKETTSFSNVNDLADGDDGGDDDDDDDDEDETAHRRLTESLITDPSMDQEADVRGADVPNPHLTWGEARQTMTRPDFIM